jgi:hypothetical protein
VNQLLASDWAVGAAYKFSRAELEQDLTGIPVTLFGDAQKFDQSDLHTVSLYLLFRHPSGFFARAEGNWYGQDNRERSGNASGHLVTSNLPSDDFWQANFWVGWRFRRSLGDISIGVLNISGKDYKLNPLNVYTELPRERVVAGRVNLRF